MAVQPIKYWAVEVWKSNGEHTVLPGTGSVPHKARGLVEKRIYVSRVGRCEPISKEQYLLLVSKDKDAAKYANNRKTKVTKSNEPTH